MEECPTEIALLILQYLSHHDIISLCDINSHWQKMKSDDRLWRTKCEEFKFDYKKNCAFQNFQENYVKYRCCLGERLRNWLDRNGLKDIINTLLPPAPYEILDGIDYTSSLGQLCMFYHLFSRGQSQGPGLFGSYMVYNDFNTILLASIKTVHNFTFFGKSLHGRPSYLLQTSLKEPNYDCAFLYASGHSFFNRGSFKSFINKYVEDLENGRFNVEEGRISSFPNYGPNTAVGEICNGLRVSCSSIPSLDSPEMVYYYRISIEFFPELSKYKACQLKKRDWLLTFKSGKQETVCGEGVIGLFPRFSAGNRDDDPILSFEGYLTFVSQNQEFRVTVPRFTFEQVSISN
ncbi:F-box only protein 3 [Boothiomyces sp. JEL0838]|nr:F-box only protein 3 [Boothiomyces sp. JEL0838]